MLETGVPAREVLEAIRSGVTPLRAVDVSFCRRAPLQEKDGGSSVMPQTPGERSSLSQLAGRVHVGTSTDRSSRGSGPGKRALLPLKGPSQDSEEHGEDEAEKDEDPEMESAMKKLKQQDVLSQFCKRQLGPRAKLRCEKVSSASKFLF